LVTAVAPFILLLAFVSPSGAAGPELIVNGSFDTNLDGWTVPASGGCSNTTWSTAGNPGGSAWMNACGEAGSDPSIYQELTGLSIGATYTLQGEYASGAPAFGDPGKPDAFEVELDGVVILALPRPDPATTFTPFSVKFTATAATHKIEFFAERDGDDSDFLIDNISVTADEDSSPTQEPSSEPTGGPIPTDDLTPPPTDDVTGSRGAEGSLSPLLAVLAVLATVAVAQAVIQRRGDRRRT
jgi:hypothetical protein